MDQHATALDAAQTRLSPVSSGAVSAVGRTRRFRLRPLLFATGAAALLAAGGYEGLNWWSTGRFMLSTDDAYLDADNVLVSPKVPGYIAQVTVEDNQPVKAGQVLARIDDRDYRTALEVAHANVDAANADIQTLIDQLAEQQQVIAEAEASVQ